MPTEERNSDIPRTTAKECWELLKSDSEYSSSQMSGVQPSIYLLTSDS